jgi:hypothetical protein
MALFQSPQVIAQKALPAARDGVGTVAHTVEFVVPAGLALNDIIEMGGLPAGHIPVDLIVSFPDADSNGTPTVAFDAGLITGRFGDSVLGSRACGSEFFAADTSARAGGVARVNKSLAGIAPTTTEQGWGLKVQAAAATLATGGRIRATFFYVSAPDQVAFA